MKISKLITYVILIGCLAAKGFAAGFELTSPAFKTNRMIPMQYSCKGSNIPPKLTWKNPPPNTQSFALIMNDPDAPNGNVIHWIVFNLPSNTKALDPKLALPIEAVTGLNSYNNSGYKSPCPPTGQHRYFFRLYALDTVLQLSDRAQYDAVMDAMQRHVLGQAVLIGLYRK